VDDRLSRGELLKRATLLAGSAALADLPAALRFHGWLDDAYAATADVVEQTLNGLVAFIVPGRDQYSQAQGVTTRTPGGIEAGTTPALIRTLDRFLPGPLPLSSTTATILMEYAKIVGFQPEKAKFVSPFANLSFAKKAQVFARIEALPEETSGPIRFLVGNLPDLTAFLAYSRPVGWRLAHYSGVSDGHKELKGYWRGRKAADPGG
jgi:hypothetical protein